MSRTSLWSRLLALATGLALAAFACSRGAPRGGADGVYSVQLHLHGSFSEGQGSIDSHSYEAQDVGCDVLWWSDHDFRIASYECVSRFGFEAAQEPLERGESWLVRLAKFRGQAKQITFRQSASGGTAEFVTSPVKEGEHSLRLRATSNTSEFEPCLQALRSPRALHQRPLAAGVTLRLAVYAEELSADARLRIQVRLSEHAPREGLPLGSTSLVYLSGSAGEVPRREGFEYQVPLSCEVGRWNELELPLTADAVRGFPQFPGQDNLFYSLTFGVETRNGARASVCFDDLRIEQEVSGAETFARQRELLDEVGALYPELQQHQGLEVSYFARHLNLFCIDTPFPDFEALARAAPPDPADPEVIDETAFKAAFIEGIVRATHERGGLVSYNHMFGAGSEDREKRRTNEDMLAILLENRAEGADLLEVGYRDRNGASLADHLWVWDQAALAGLRLVGVGVSDSHGGPDERWRGSENNFVTWIHARSSDKQDLIDGLRAGRVFFGDIELFDGSLDLVTDAGHRMGSTVLTDRREVFVDVLASGIQADALVVVVVSGEPTSRLPARPGTFSERQRIELPEGPSSVRFELRDGAGRAFVASNPIHFLREIPDGGLADPAVAFDRDGLRSRQVEGVQLLAWRREDAAESRRVVLRVRARAGTIALDHAGPVSVSFAGLEGRSSAADGALLLTDLEGEGEIVLDLELASTR